MRMERDECIRGIGTVKEVLPKTMFRVEMANGHMAVAHMGPKMRKHPVRIVPGDKVALEFSPYDLNQARITFREK